jgi:type VI secretion system protein ImpC
MAEQATQSTASDRINLVYESMIGDKAEEIELPLRLLVLGDYTLNESSEYFSDQEPVVLKTPGIDSLFLRYQPEITLTVKNCLVDDGSSLALSFRFRTLKDFDPDQLVRNSRELSSIIKFITDLGDVLQQSGQSGIDTESIDGAMLSILNAEGISVDSLNASNDKLGWLISSLEIRIKSQLDELLHDERFMQLEAAWRSISFLVERTDFTENCEIAVVNASKSALLADFEDSPEIVRTQYYQSVYTAEFGQFGGRPYAAIIADYEFGPSTKDVWLLQRIASVSAISHAPFIAAASALFFSIDSYFRFSKLRDIKSIFEQPSYTKWTSFRATSDARYIGLTLPSFLLRQPHSIVIGPIEYHETVRKNKVSMCWGNAAFAFASRLVDSFARYRWCLNITGKQDGRVSGLSVTGSALGGMHTGKIPTQFLLTDKRESDVVAQGFIPLSVHKGDDMAAFYSAYSVQSFAEEENRDTRDISARLGAQLPYLLIVSRISHYIKIMQREHIGSWKNRREIDHALNNWLRQYVSDMDNPAPGVRSRRPLRRADIKVREVEGKGDWYLTKIQITPHVKYMGSAFSLSETGKLEKT